MRARGLGQSLPDISQLPATGDLQAQLAHGENLMTSAKAALNGDPNAAGNLLSAGVTLASGMGGGDTVGTIVRDIVTIGSATAIGAVGGPWGAAAGFIVSSVEVALQTIFGIGPGNNVTYLSGEPTAGAQDLATRKTQWDAMAGHLGLESLHPVGWSFMDYLAVKYPPNLVTADLNEMFNLAKTNVTQTGTNVTTSNLNSGTPRAKDYPKYVLPLCTPVFFNWYQPDKIQDCINNEYFSWALPSTEDPSQSTSKPSADHLRYLWQNDTLAIVSKGKQLSQTQIMDYAEAHRPPAMFWASDLYVVQHGWPSWSQIFTNLPTMVGLTTWTGILAAGGSIQSVTAELIFQQKILYDLDGSVPPLFRLLVESALRQARAERAAAAAQVSLVTTAAGLSTAGMVGAVTAGVTGAIITGILVYSAVNKVSPVETTRLGLARMGRLR